MHKHYMRHKMIYSLAKCTIGKSMVKKYDYKTDVIDLPKDGPYIVMANHTTEADMAMVALAVKQHMYFVCGEHLLRSKFAKQMVFGVDPIPEYKGALAMQTVKEIMARTRQGHNIMIFPEGNRSFDGETKPVSLSTGKLVKLAKAGLVTYHMQGGYFVAPRWSYKFRTGKCEGHVVGVYSPEEVSKMTARQIVDIINRDIYENAYETQRKQMIPYVNDGHLAEGLENFLVICPKCGAYDSMTSHGNSFECACCGQAGVYDEYGFLRGEGLRFDSVFDWGQWMEGRFDEDMAKRADEDVLFDESDLVLYQITDDHRRIDLADGSMTVHRDRLEMAGKIFKFDEMEAMAMLYYGKTLLFTIAGVHYGITGEHFHAWKCDRLYRLHEADSESKRLEKTGK